MEVHGRQPAEPHLPQQRFLQDQERLQDASRDRIRRAREILIDLATEPQQHIADARRADQAEVEGTRERRRRDVVDLSKMAHPYDQSLDEARLQKVDELRRAHMAGTLSSPQQIERAAEQMLAGDQ